MDILAAAIAFFRGHPAVSALVDPASVSGRPNQDLALPALVLESLEGSPRQTIQQGIVVNQPRFRIHCVAGNSGAPDHVPDLGAAADVADAVRQALTDAVGQVVNDVRVDRVLIEAESGAFEDPVTHNGRVTFRVALSVREA